MTYNTFIRLVKLGVKEFNGVTIWTNPNGVFDGMFIVSGPDKYRGLGVFMTPKVLMRLMNLKASIRLHSGMFVYYSHKLGWVTDRYNSGIYVHTHKESVIHYVFGKSS